MYMHTKREEKSGIYSSGIEKSLGNGEREIRRPRGRIIIARDGKKFIGGKRRTERVAI